MTIKSMQLQETTWKKLWKIKLDKGFESLNDVIEYLLKREKG